MKNVSNPRRNRNRNNGKRNQNSRDRNFQSGGSDTKVRGTAQQVLDKYQALARDANAAGDRIAAEGFLQHAEHYYRVLNPDRAETGEGGQHNDRKPRPNRQESNVADTREETVKAEKPPEPVQETAEPVNEAKAEETTTEDKPRRRGRPRKTPAPEAEVKAKDDGASETAA